MNPVTDRQTSVRGVFGGWSAGWRALTNSQRSGWSNLGLQIERTDSLGQTYNLTGLQAYISANQNLTTIGATTISDAPLLLPPDAPVGMTLTMDTAPADVVSLAYNPPPAGIDLVVEMTGPVSAGRNFAPRSSYKFIASVAGGGASPEDLLSAYEAIYGEFPAGAKVFLRAKTVDTASGQSSPWVYIDTIIL